MGRAVTGQEPFGAEGPDYPDLRDATQRAREGCLADMPEDNLNLEEWLGELRRWRLLSRPGRFTGLLDLERSSIRIGDLLLCGMRRGDSKGWSTGIVEFAPARPGRRTGLYLRNPRSSIGGEAGDMQYDQELRVIMHFREEQIAALSLLDRTDVEYRGPIQRRILDELLAHGMISGWNYATPLNWGQLPERFDRLPEGGYPAVFAVETSARLAKISLTAKGKRELAVAALKRNPRRSY